MLIRICNNIFAQLKELLKMHPILANDGLWSIANKCFGIVILKEVISISKKFLFHSSSQGKQNKITCAHIYANQKRLIYG